MNSRHKFGVGRLGWLGKNLVTLVVMGIPAWIILVGLFSERNGSLRIVLDETAVEVAIDSQAYEPTGKSVGPIDLPPGKHDLKISRGGRTLFSREVELNSGELAEVHAVWVTEQAENESVASEGPRLEPGRGLEGHISAVTGVGFSDGGKRVVSVGGDRALRFWNLEEGTTERAIEAHYSSIEALVIPGDGKRVLTFGNDSIARVWDVKDGEEIRSFQAIMGTRLTSAVPSPDSKYIALGGENGLVRVFDFQSGEIWRSHLFAPASVASLAYSPDGQTLLVGLVASPTAIRGIDVYDIAADRVIQHLEGHDGVVLGLAFMPDGRQAISGGSDQTLRIWDLRTGREIRRFDVNALVRCLTVSPDGRYVLAGTGNFWSRITGWKTAETYGVIVYDLKEGRKVGRFETSGQVFCLALSPDGRTALAGSEDHLVHAWDMPKALTKIAKSVTPANKPGVKADPKA